MDRRAARTSPHLGEGSAYKLRKATSPSPHRSLGHHGGSSSRCSDAEQVWGVLVWRRVEVYANRPQTCREPAAGHGSPASVGCSGLEEV